MAGASGKTGDIGGIPAVVLEAGGYRAAICPEMGANCFLLEHEGASFLRVPRDMAAFREKPNIYGMPLLFPPNRVKGGTFMFRGRRYALPINEPARGNHLHGALSSSGFALLEKEARDDSCRAAFGFRATKEHPYSTFPHEFEIALEYSLGPGGLTQRVTIRNDGDADMPTGLGFHTTLNCPFLPDTSPGDYLFGLSVSRQIPLSPDTVLPTGEIEASNPLLSALRSHAAHPQGRPLSAHFRSEPLPDVRMDGAGEAVLRHVPTGRSLVYRVDPRFAFWMLWNMDGISGFICPEPQTWIVDAPNSALPPEESGFRALPPGASLTLTSTLTET